MKIQDTYALWYGVWPYVVTLQTVYKSINDNGDAGIPVEKKHINKIWSKVTEYK